MRREDPSRRSKYGLTSKGKRVAVSGMGMVTPLGNSVLENWDRLLRGQSGLDFIQSFDTSPFNVKIGGEVRGLDVETYLGRNKMHKISNASVPFAIAAAKEAAETSGFAEWNHDPSRVGIYLASGEVENRYVSGYEKSWIRLWEDSLKENGLDYKKVGSTLLRILDPFVILKALPNNALCQLSVLYNVMGVSNNIVMSGASGAQAIGEAVHNIQRGDADIMIAGGYDSLLSLSVFVDYVRLEVMTKERKHPGKAIRPFDLNRDGFAIGQGAGIVILEEMEHAKSRGAPILAEVVGYGSSADAYDVREDPKDGRGIALCMEMALRRAGLEPDEIDYINAEGNALESSDRAETSAYKRVFSTGARKVAISSVKPAVGYLGVASGPVEFVFAVMAVRTDIVPPTMNLTVPDPQCDLDYVPLERREVNVQHALTINRGLGGQNAALIVKKADTGTSYDAIFSGPEGELMEKKVHDV